MNTAICGGVLKAADKNDDVCVACVRLFKYCIPAYGGDFRQRLCAFIEKQFVVRALRGEGVISTPTGLGKLSILYGEHVIPPEIANILNDRDPGAWYKLFRVMVKG